MIKSSQLYPGMYQNKWGQKDKQGDFTSPFHSYVTSPPGVLHPALGFPALEGCRPDRVSPEEVTKTLRGLEKLSCEERLKAASQYLKRASRVLKRDFSQIHAVLVQCIRGLNWKMLGLCQEKKFLPVGIMKPWNMLPRELVDACGGLTLAGWHVPTEIAPSLPSSTGHRKENIAKSSWVETRTGRGHSSVTDTSKTDLTWRS